jgi:hypothetical protein
MSKFHETLSDRGVYMRYFCSLSLSSRVAHKRLVRICFGDHDRQIALVVNHKNEATRQHHILGSADSLNCALRMRPKLLSWCPITTRSKVWEENYCAARSKSRATRKWAASPPKCYGTM